MFLRIIEQKLISKLGKGKAIIVIGPRQVGKTTLIKKVLDTKEHLFLDADDPTVRLLLQDANLIQLKKIIGKHKIIFIDEIQRIKNIGLTLKIITDQLKNVQIIASGSSAFEVQNLLNEPLTGRKWEFTLLPISWNELENKIGYVQAQQQLPLRLIYGMYPDVINNIGEEEDILNQLTNSYLYKDVFAHYNIRKSEILEKLLQALALQVGSEVSYNELSSLLGIDKNTVSHYITILEQAYIIFKLPSFARNLRNEIKHNKKIYFYDNGIRNSIIGNFNAITNRQDIGALWENFLISERVKNNAYTKNKVHGYFWRTVQQQEIDYIEDYAGDIFAYEIKWNEKAKTKKHETFVKTYKASLEIITPNNFRTFIE